MNETGALAARRATLLQAAAKVARNVASILDPDALLEQTVDIICDEFGFYYAGVFLIDESGEWAVLRSGRGESGKIMMAEGHRLKVDGHSMIGRATGERRALIALDVGEEPVHFKNPHLPATRSEMALPLIAGGTLIGALTVQSVEEAAFSDDDIMVLQGMADQLAIAIQNAHLYKENQTLLLRSSRRARLLQAAAEVGKDVTSILDLDELLNRTVDVICDTYGFYYAGVFLLDETGEWAVLQAGRGEAGQEMLAAGHRLKVNGLSMIGAAVSTHKARIALDVGEEPVHFKNPYLPRTRSEMALPLGVGNQVIGAVTVQSVEEAAFSDEDITSLQAMADQLAIALNNAQLLKELEAAHAELVRTKMFEAMATATLQAIHWIGNKTLPIAASVGRLKEDLASLADAEPRTTASMREDLDIIGESARLIIEVKEHLIGPAREYKPHPIMVDDVVRDAVMVSGIPEAMVHYVIASGMPMAVADTMQLSRAFGYVLKNALEATAHVPSPSLIVEVAPAGDFVAVRFADNGPGIPEENLDKIWAPFYTTKGVSHAGLGLAACERILNQGDGKVSVANKPDGGALFELLIPVFKGKSPATSLPSGKTILVVDDDDAWSQFIVKALTGAGNKVSRSAELPDDLTAFDVILLDDVLRAGNSSEILASLRQAGLVSKTLVVVSQMTAERATALMQVGIRDIHPKPYTTADLGALFS